MAPSLPGLSTVFDSYTGETLRILPPTIVPRTLYFIHCSSTHIPYIVYSGWRVGDGGGLVGWRLLAPSVQICQSVT